MLGRPITNILSILFSFLWSPQVAHVGMNPLNGASSTDAVHRQADVLLEHLPLDSPLGHVRDSLLTDGYCILHSVMTPDECGRAIESIWAFIEDSSNARVSRSDPSTWYPDENNGDDPFPYTGFKSFSDMFQSNGAGWVNGEIRELLADRIFQPLYQTRELHSSKEGFTFHRPTAPDGDFCPPDVWLNSSTQKPMVCTKQQSKSLGEHFDQGYASEGFQTIQSLVALEDQVPGVDGCFLCWPRSHGLVHQALTKDIYRGKFSWVPLTDQEITRLQNEFSLEPKRIYLAKGDVVLWRSDLVHAALPPSGSTPRFRAVAYTSMQPASLTPKHVYLDKMNAYKQRRTGDHRPHVESWHIHKQININHRCSFRTSPPLVTKRLAELYGLVQYTQTEDEWRHAEQSAIIQGVRFVPDQHDDVTLHLAPIRQCTARLEYISTDLSMVGQDKYLGGMSSSCGDFVYGVPGSAKRVLRINVQTKFMDMVGPSFEGKFKWLRGLDVPSNVMNDPDFPRGCCLALPSNACSVLKINPETQAITTFGENVLASRVGNTGWFYHGGNLASNGMVYCIPANASHVLKVCPRTNQVWTIGPSFGAGRQKWFGGIVGTDGCIYGIPHNEVGVLKIDPTNDECTVLLQDEEKPLPPGQWKWHGGLAAGDKIYGFPNNADQVLVVNVKTQQVYMVGDASVLKSGRHRIPQDGRYKYLGGALTRDKQSVYLFPCDAERVLKIDVTTDILELVGPLLLDGENKYQNGFVARDGCLYGIPQRALGVLRIDPRDDHVDVMACSEDMIGTKDKFEGGVMGHDGCIYCIPLRAKTCVKVVPGRSD